MQKSFQILESFWLSEAFPFPKFFRLIWRLATWWRCRRMQVTTEELPGQLRIDTAVSHRCAPNRFNPTCLHRIPRCKEGSKAWSHLIIGWCLAVSKSCHGLSFMTVFVAWYCLFHCDMFLPNFGHCLAFVFWVAHSTWDLWEFPSLNWSPSKLRQSNFTEVGFETLPLHFLFSVQTGNSLLIFTKSKRQSFCCAYCPRRALCGHRVQDTLHCWKASALVVWLISTVLTITLWVGAQICRELWSCISLLTVPKCCETVPIKRSPSKSRVSCSWTMDHCDIST